jgi:orotidine-5'-phosphate decarboxylase
MINARDRVILALDVPTASAAREIANELRGEVGAFKIGLQLFTAEGPALVRELIRSGDRVFLDLKFHDIPNTVARAAVEAARLGVWMFNIHALGGREMMRRTVADVSEACQRESLAKPHLIAVTVLTSSGPNELAEVGIGRDVDSEVVELVRLTAECGMDGVVASAREAKRIRAIADERFLIVTPGIRFGPNASDTDFGTPDDQKRVMTPAAALAAGSDYLVVGRPVTAARDRVAAVRRIVGEIVETE